MDVVAIFGPTASGKSAVALELAELVGGEIVSCDAMQLYRGLPILTNQPSAAETARAPHHLIGVWELDHSGSVAEYAALAHAAIDDVRRPRPGGGRLRWERPLPARGAGRACRCRRRCRRPTGRGSSSCTSAREPVPRTRTLAAADARAAAAVHPHDRRRVVRALELHAAGSSLAPEHDRLWAADARRPTAIVGLDVPAELVSGRIARRTEAMFAAGVVDEVRAARAEHRFSATAERIHGLQDVTALLRRPDRPGRGAAAAERAHPPVRQAPAHVDAASAGGRTGRRRPRPPQRSPPRSWRRCEAGRREHDAVREARDALVIVAAAAPVTAAVAVLAGIAAGDVRGWAQWVIGPLVVAVLLLGTLGSALLLADRLGSRYLSARPHTVSRLRWSRSR